MTPLTGKGSLIAGVLAALGASVCCVAPLVLLALGIGGTWVGSLTAMAPYRPIFIALTLLFLGLAFRRLYLVPQVCAPGAPCIDPSVVKRRRLTFWIVTVLLLALLAVPVAGLTVLLKEGSHAQTADYRVCRLAAPGAGRRAENCHARREKHDVRTLSGHGSEVA